MNQDTLRVDQYQNIATAVGDGIPLQDVGQRTVLPSTFIGGPRSMKGLYHDGMAIVHSSTTPDYFITMTCNPLWTEITVLLDHGQAAQDRPDIVARVFKIKLDLLLKELTDHEKGIFGKVVAHMHVIEFQKRGLPHAHILLIMDRNDKPCTPEFVDTVVCAELPDPVAFPDLHNIIVSSMLHGPCGARNMQSPCMKDDKCSKKYPKPFSEHTTLPVNTYPQYRRSDNGRTAVKNHQVFTNADVVPYNPYLSAKYGCHINVEVATGIQCVKYLYKYVYKGHDRTCVSVENDRHAEGPVDEIKEYLDARYVSACEAAWRIFKFPLHMNYPTVQRLQLHLPDMQSVTFDPDAETGEDLLDNDNIQKTTLTEFFTACQQYPEHAAGLLYCDFPAKFTWDRKTKSWHPRRGRFSTIGRVQFCTPISGERYYLRMLLYVVMCPLSFEYLRTYEGRLYGTFQEACLARGLLESDDEWDTCLNEAGFIQSGHQLRQLFAVILLGNTPADPSGLFDRHLPNLSDDCRYRFETLFNNPHPTDNEIKDLTLQYIEIFLHKAGKTLTDCGLPNPVNVIRNLTGVSRIITDELSYDTVKLQNKWDAEYPRTTTEQRNIIDTITAAVDAGQSGLFFIDGPGGTGKTFVENLMLAYVRSRGYVALAVASSGIASILLDGGRTSHSRFKIPLDIQHDSIAAIKCQSQLAELIRRTKLIIWDEAPAQHRYCFEAVDRTLRDITGVDSWFGGITTVLSGTYFPLEFTSDLIIGDFRQCLPVIPGASRGEITSAAISNASFWRDITMLRLTTNMRLLAQAAHMSPPQLQHTQQFAKWLLDLGDGIDNDGDQVELPPGIHDVLLPILTCFRYLSTSF
jgi:hypothetical protein